MSRRLVPVLSAVLATAFFGGLAFGSPLSSLLFVGPVVALLAWVAVHGRRPAREEARWLSPAPAPAPGRPVLAVPGTSRQVATALGRAESHELAFSAWFGIGVGFLVVIFVTFAVINADDNGQVWLEMVGMSPWFAHPLAGMTIVAAHRAATRPTRDGTEELFESCPTEPVVRTLALLRTAVVPVGVFTAFLVAYSVALYLGSPAIHGPLSFHALPVLAAGPVLVAGAVFLGVALGSWVRFGLAPVVAVVAVGFFALRLSTAGDPGWNGSSALSTFGPQADSPLLVELLPTWWYLLWVAALGVAVAVMAVLRSRRDRLVWLTGAAAVAVAVVAALLGTAPPGGGEARRVADLVAHPAAHQSCDRSPGGTLQVCTYRPYGELRRRVLAAVGPVGRALPATVPPMTIRQGFGGDEDDLPARVRRLIPTGIPEQGEGEIEIDYAGDDAALQEYRLRVAFAGLGLPLPPETADEGPASIAGQARGVVALWLAARGLDLDEALHLATVENPGDPDQNLVRGGGNDAFERGLAWPTMCGPVVWSPQDLEAARTLMRAPQAKVAAVVARGFNRWSDPTTATDELLGELGLPSAGPAETVVIRTEAHC